MTIMEEHSGRRRKMLINKIPVSLLDKGKKFFQFFPARPPQLCQENIYVNRLRPAGAKEKRVFVLISQQWLEQVKLVNKRMTQTTNSHRCNYLSGYGQRPISQTDQFRLVFEGVNKKKSTAMAHIAFPNLLID